MTIESGDPFDSPHLGKCYSGGRPHTLGQRIKQRKDIPLKPVREADVVPLMVPLIDLRLDQCRYVYGDSGGYLFCGLTTLASSISYCPEHYDLCTTPRAPLVLPSSLAA